MIPDANHPAWQQLIFGHIDIRFTHVGASMLVFNSVVSYRQDPTAANMTRLVRQARNLFVKYEPQLATEIRQLFSPDPPCSTQPTK